MCFVFFVLLFRVCCVFVLHFSSFARFSSFVLFFYVFFILCGRWFCRLLLVSFCGLFDCGFLGLVFCVCFFFVCLAFLGLSGVFFFFYDCVSSGLVYFVLLVLWCFVLVRW